MIVKRYTPREIAHSYDSAFRGEGTEPPLCMYVRASAYDAMRAALDDLYSVQNGCPLPKYQADWDKAMLDAGRLLGYRIPATTGEKA